MRKFLFILFFFSLPAMAQPIDTIKQIDQVFSQWNNATPGGMIQLMRGDKVLYNKAFGLADLEHNTPNTTETISESGSVAKQFTAMAVLLLASEGKLSLTDDVRKFIPELPRYAAPITVQQLINHTSGLKEWSILFEMTGWPRTTRVYNNEWGLRIICRQKTTNFTPGTEYSYSNSNYLLLFFIVERVSGKSFSDFTNERIFKPLSMTHTRWRSNFREVIPNRAIAYNHIKEGFEQLMPFENSHGPGALLTTTGDLMKWNKLLENHTIGGDRVHQWRIQKGKLANGKEINYASGLEISAHNDLMKINHTGFTAGYRALLSYYPQKKFSLAILSNDSGFDPFDTDKKIAELFFGPIVKKAIEPSYIVVGEANLKKFVGLYRNIKSYDVVKFEWKEGNLWLQEKMMKATHKDTLIENGTKWAFVNPSKLTAFYSGDSSSYRKVESPSKTIDDFVGDFYSEEIETKYSIAKIENGLLLTIGAFPPRKLSPLFKDSFTTGYDLFEFKRDKRGKVVLLEVSKSAVERILFEKN